jgi:hypothetical protein
MVNQPAPRSDEDRVVPTGRDPFVDLVRAASLVVVVLYHWCFTVFDWRADGPHASNPIGYTRGLWLLTWALQVMPLFFFVGGWATWSGWHAAQARGDTMGGYLVRRLREIALPALGLIVAWWAIAITMAAVYDIDWMGRVMLLVLSPLWFAGTYLLIIAALPLWLWLHRRFGVLLPVWLAGAAALVDVARFSHDVPWIGWANMWFVWGLVFVVGFSYDRVCAIDRRQQQAIMWAGLFGLIGLVWAGLYPASMVGVPGDKFSNMSPPSLAIVALATFQIGALALLRPAVLARLDRPRWVRFRSLMNTYAMPLYLLHSTGMALALYGFWRLTGKRADNLEISGLWWATRPLAVLVPLLITLPLLWAYGRLGARSRPLPLTAKPGGVAGG